MRILQVRLKNFSRVLTGLGKTSVTIDLTNTTQRINLFSGPNGTGKTSIMASLHPFAFNNTMDDRDNSELIIAEKSGEKVVIIEDELHLYEIKHIYKRGSKDSLSVKSYINKDGVELNPPGNVGEFKEIVYELFGLDETILSLLTLGVNVDGFINKSGTDRKNFATKIFEDLNIYNVHFKKVTTNARNLKALMTNISSKLVKYKDLDLDDTKKTLRQIEIRERKVYEEIRQIRTDIGSINTLIDSKRETIATYEQKKAKVGLLLDEIGNIGKTKKTSLSEDELNASISSLEQELFNLTVKKASIETNLTSLLEQINSKQELKASFESNEVKLSSIENYDDMIKLQSSLQLDIDNIEKELSSYPSLSKYDRTGLIKATIYIDELLNQCGDLLVYENDLVVKVYDKYTKTGDTLEEKINKSIMSNTDNIRNYQLLRLNNIDMSDVKLQKDCSDSECPYKKFYNLYIERIKDNNASDIEKMENIRTIISSLEDMSSIISIIRRIRKFISDNPILKELPSFVFDPNNCISLYIKQREVHDKYKLIELIDLLEKRQNLESLRDKLIIVTDKITNYNNSKDMVDNLKTNIDNLNKDLTSLNTTFAKYKDELSQITSDILDVESRKLLYINDKFIVETINSKRIEISKLSDEIRLMEDDMSDINRLMDKKSQLLSSDKMLNEERQELNNSMSSIKVTLADYESLKEDEARITEEYEIYIAIREAVSPSKGIPTDFIEDYVKEMADYINDLLDVVYGGTLRIHGDGIVVDENEFSIPYIKNGTIIKDISSASQGERAFLSLAFSLAMVKLADCKYNIMLLDEADTTLDVNSRSKFIPILEEYMDSIGGVQVFVISHNNMFDSYPVELILTAPDTTSNTTTNNVIKLY